jgi:hypothetical protein
MSGYTHRIRLSVMGDHISTTAPHRVLIVGHRECIARRIKMSRSRLSHRDAHWLNAFLTVCSLSFRVLRWRVSSGADTPNSGVTGSNASSRALTRRKIGRGCGRSPGRSLCGDAARSQGRLCRALAQVAFVQGRPLRVLNSTLLTTRRGGYSCRV